MLSFIPSKTQRRTRCQGAFLQKWSLGILLEIKQQPMSRKRLEAWMVQAGEPLLFIKKSL